MLDLQAPYFTQAAVLEILPELPAKTLQNWLSRNIVTLEVQNPGRQAKRYYTAYGVLLLAFMSAMAERKVGPTSAFDMGLLVANRALELSGKGFEFFNSDGVNQIPYPSNQYRLCMRHTIERFEDRVFLSVVGDRLDAESWQRTLHAPIYTVIETDLFIIDIVNRILRWMSDNPGKINHRRPST